MKRDDNKKVTLGGYNFYIYPFGAMRAAHISGDLFGVAAPLVAAIASLLSANGLDDSNESIMDMDAGKAIRYIIPAFSTINGETVEKLIRLLIIKYQNVAYDTDEDQVAKWLDENEVDIVFRRDLPNLYMLAWEVIKLNFGGFFEMLSNLFGEQDGVLAETTTLRRMENLIRPGSAN